MKLVSPLIKLNLLRLQSLAANQEALQRGLVATKPLSLTRLRELCELGEKMIAADRAQAAAETSACRDNSRPLDFVLPSR